MAFLLFRDRRTTLPTDEPEHIASTVVAAKSPRLVGVDAARGCALFGMIVVHVFRLGYPSNLAPSWMSSVFYGRSAALFATLAGVSLALISGGSRPRADRVSIDRRSIAVRAAVIGAIGLTLGLVGSELEIILVQYAVMFLLAIPFLNLPVARLAWWGAGWVLVAPQVSFVIYLLMSGAGVQPESGADPTWASFLHPVALLSGLLFTGAYPVLQWFSYVLLGLLLGRLTLTSLKIQLSLVFCGITLAVTAHITSTLLLASSAAQTTLTRLSRYYGPERNELYDGLLKSESWWWLAVDLPHAGTTFALGTTMGTAAFALGLCLVIARRYSRWLSPLAAPGSLTLTLYSAHILIMAMVIGRNRYYNPDPLFWVQVAGMVVAGLVFRRAGMRGPLEALAARAANAAQRGRK